MGLFFVVEAWWARRKFRHRERGRFNRTFPLRWMSEGQLIRQEIRLGAPWTADGFRSSWAKGCKKAGVVGVTFHDLRGTAVTRLAIAGCSEAEIATITGHSLRDVGQILDAHYLKRDPALAKSAIRKLETRTKIPDRAPDRA